MSNRDPERELAKLLAQLPSWKRKLLRLDYDGLRYSSNVDEKADWAESGYQLRVDEQTQAQYETIIRQIPAEWKAYRRKLARLSPLLVPKGKPGRRRKEVLAEEAVGLHRQGKNYVQIAAELNRRHGPGTTTSEAVRKFVSRYPDRT